MKKSIQLLVLSGLMLTIALASGFAMGSKNKAKVSKNRESEYTAPDFNLPDVLGRSTLDLKNYRGKVVLINFF